MSETRTVIVTGVDDNVGTHITYDGLGRVTSTTNRDGTSTTNSYTGATVTSSDENGHGTVQTLQAFGNPDEARLTAVTDADGKNWNYEYNALGSLSRVTAPDGITRMWQYDALSRLQFETHPESGTTFYNARDPAGKRGPGLVRRACGIGSGHPEPFVYLTRPSWWTPIDPRTSPEPSPYFDSKLRARMKSEPEPVRGWQRLLAPISGWKPAMAVALAAVVAVGISVYKGPEPITENPVVVQPGTAVSDLQKLDKNQELYASFDLLDDDEDVNP